MRKPTVGSLFAGIGGFDLGFERAGFEIRWQVEIDPFCQAVLAKHWPHVRRYEDVREVGAELERVDVICGGFPCQPVSVAGKRLAQADARWLWPEFARLVRTLRPNYVVVENVPGLLTAGMGDVLGDLAACGFDAEWDCLPASAIGAPHRRDRLWLVAYSHSDGAVGIRRERNHYNSEWHGETQVQERQDFIARVNRSSDARGSRVTAGATVEFSDSARCQYVGESDARALVFCEGQRIDPAVASAGWWDVEPNVGRVAHGVSARVDRLRGLGNAVVPQITEWIARQIKPHLEG